MTTMMTMCRKDDNLQFRQLVSNEWTESSVRCIEETSSLGLCVVEPRALHFQRDEPSDSVWNSVDHRVWKETAGCRSKTERQTIDVQFTATARRQNQMQLQLVPNAAKNSTSTWESKKQNFVHS